MTKIVLNVQDEQKAMRLLALFGDLEYVNAQVEKSEIAYTDVVDELNFAASERLSGYIGRTADSVANEMEQIITGAEYGKI